MTTSHENTPTTEAAQGTRPAPTFLGALRRNPFVSDETGQAMVEFAVVGPVLLFLMVSIWHFFQLSHAQQNFLISQRNLAFGTILNRTSMNWKGESFSVTGHKSDVGFGTGEWLGLGFLDIRNSIRLYPPPRLLFTNPWSNGVEHFMNGVVAPFMVYRPGRSAFSQITSIGSLSLDNIIGTPYEAMGLNADSYYKPTGTITVDGNTFNEISRHNTTNPFRNVLLGMGSFFAEGTAVRGGSRTLEGASGLSFDQLPMAVRFPIIVDPWKADFVNGRNITSKTGVEKIIRGRSGGLTFYENLYGTACLAWISITSLAIPISSTLGLFGSDVDDGSLFLNPREWYNQGRTSYFNLLPRNKYRYKVDARTGSNGKGNMNLNEINTRRLRSLSGNNLVEAWK